MIYDNKTSGLQKRLKGENTFRIFGFIKVFSIINKQAGQPHVGADLAKRY